MSTVKADVFGRLRPRLPGLEKQLPDLFVRRAKESLQDPWTFRIELPHVERTALAGEDPAEKHHLNHIGESGVFLDHIFMRFCSTITSSDDAQSRPLLIRDASRIGGQI